ncbi:MAG: TonB-dependent receptor plug domain-containing protein [Bacteroidales bacterium]
MVNRSKALFLLLFLIASSISFSQQVSINVDSRPLSEVLIGLASNYNIQISFDDRNLSQFKVSLSGTFDSPETAIHKLIDGLPLEIVKKEDVFIIFPPKKPDKPKSFSLTGQVLEKGSRESLPYSHVIINNYGMATDLKGSFAFLSSTDSVFTVKVSHLGYFILDTLVNGTADLHFLLTPSLIGLSEVEIKNSLIERSTLIGDQAGMMKLNHQIANFLPGFGDNSVFNLLRLQPGILASGEQTNELIIWGCYEGQSKVIFDGFTIYGLKNFNDNISSFNPLMAKDIEVYKGGYDARYGERVGGIVNITGKNGNTLRPSFSVDINNMTMNGMVEVPLFRNSSLVVALRHTYYELYNPGDLNSLIRRNNDPDTTNDVDLNIVPDYRFRDINIKYSAKIRDRDLFYISLYAGNDRFSYSIEEPVDNVVITKKTQEDNTQSGGAIFYGKTWKNGYSTNFSLNYSVLKSDFSDDLTVERILIQQIDQVKNMDARNIIREKTFQVDNRFPVHHSHILEGGMVYKYNQVELAEDTFNIVQAGISGEARRLTLFFQDNIALSKRVDFKAGLRITHAINLKKLYLEPRFSVSVKAGESWKINAAWGIYDQFITKSSVLDDQGNYRYIWAVCDNESIPVLLANHFVLGTSYFHNDFTVSLEGYFKNVTGLTRYVKNAHLGIEGIYEGKGRSYGIDVMIKKDYRGHSAWVAYSLSRTEELFEYFKNDAYRRAPQDQRHELKLATLVNLDPFYISADYVFGSGFPSSPSLLSEEQDNLTYSRLDLAFIYKFLDRKLKGEIGLSVLNVLNTQNIKYANFERVATNQTNYINIYSESIPLTPALYLKLAL